MTAPRRPAVGPMLRAVTAAVKGAGGLPPRDKAAVQLARRYAQLLDEARNTPQEAGTYAELGPKLLATLTALGLTRAGRGAKGGPDATAPAPETALERLRRSAATRATRARGGARAH